jgi:hypothetical protein
MSNRAKLNSKTGPEAAIACGNCIHFSNAPAAMEEAFAGLTTMSSGFGSVRAHDGICKRHGYYLAAWDRCADFAAAEVR